MVDKIGNGPGYSYPQVNDKRVNTNAAGAGEKFQLDYGKEGAIYELSSEALKRQQAEKNLSTKTKDTAKTESDGVRLTLSNTATERPESAKNEGSVAGGGILDALTGMVSKIVATIKDFFSSIWNDEPIKDVADKVGESIEKPEASTISEEIKVEKPKTQFEKAKAEAEAFLSSAEGKKVARNSDLLTYYDKHGTVVSVSPSDRQRILYGDRNQIEV